MTTPPNNLNWRVGELERRMTRMEDQELRAKLALVEREVREAHADMEKMDKRTNEALRRIDLRTTWTQRTLITLLASSIVALVAVVLSSAGG